MGVLPGANHRNIWITALCEPIQSLKWDARLRVLPVLDPSLERQFQGVT